MRASRLGKFGVVLTILILIVSDVASVSGRGNASSASVLARPEKEEWLSIINAQRAKGCRCGSKWYAAVPPLVWNNQLAAAAQKHSNDMAKHRFFSHTGHNGSQMEDRISAEGYRWINCAENIFKGSQVAADAMKSWMKSPGHCANIMNSNYKDVGLAVNNDIWTMVLARAGK